MPATLAKARSKRAASAASHPEKSASTQVNIYEAKTHLSSLLQRAANGEEIIVAKAGHPIARIVQILPTPNPAQRRVFGQNFLGITYMAPDWDAPMSEEELADWGM